MDRKLGAAVISGGDFLATFISLLCKGLDRLGI